MIKKTITYTDYDGESRTEDFYFNLSKAELVEMAYGTTGGLEKKLKKIIDARDNKELMDIFKDLILRSYGEKSLDGRRFVKSKELAEQFAQTEAYSELFMELATSDKAASEFINGIVPAAIAEEIAKNPQIAAFPALNN